MVVPVSMMLLVMSGALSLWTTQVTCLGRLQNRLQTHRLRIRRHNRQNRRCHRCRRHCCWW